MLRWAEMNAFSPLMRSHEGIRPDSNAQFDAPQDIEGYARLSRIHAALKPYLQKLDRENHTRGVPVMRPLFFYYDGEEDRTQQYEYLLGRELLVAPVLTQGRKDWDVYLPQDGWVHLWTGETYRGGRHTVPAPVGEPPVFCRASSEYLTAFLALREA
jgi:alpha-glucosidase